MPVKYRIKLYVRNGYYHIYNSGVDGRDVFMDDQDYWFFLNLLKSYLSPIQALQVEAETSKFKPERPYKQRQREDMNLNQQVTLLAYCLMPKHFQLLVKQTSVDGITKFMRRLCTSYVAYFNKRHNRSGGLFQGVYKGVLIEDHKNIIVVANQVHQEPISVRKMGLISTSSGSPTQYPYSSYHHYLQGSGPEWLDRSDLERLRSDLLRSSP